MQCPKCQSENRGDGRFCLECGERLGVECPQCGKALPRGAKFCDECGHKLSPPTEAISKSLSFEEKLCKIQRYLPEGLAEKILSQRDRIEGERKQVTVMFCDMVGFTQLSERLGPEEAYGIMDQVYEILIHSVHDYEGTVNEMTGDGVLAIFGAPIALEDAPQRAARSALAIHRYMAEFSSKLRQEKEDIPAIKMRIGINTGPVVVGTLGNDLRVEFKAVGDTVNLASRMEGLAEPGTCYVTEETFKLTEGFFRFEALGEKKIEGKEEPVKAYRLIATSTRRTRFDVSAERGLTPFVGRERELELLLDGFERVKSGRGQAFSIVADAGIGKSRLLYEFRKAVSSEDATFLEGRCLSYSRDVGYHPIVDSLKATFDIHEDDKDSEIREKVKTGLEILGADEASTLPYLLDLLSVRDNGVEKKPMSPETRKTRIVEALRQIVVKGSEIRPLVLTFEDLYWVDKSSEYVLKSLLESIPGVRVLLLLTYRPTYVHTWGGKSYHSQLNLNRLSNRESLSMMTHLLETEEIHSDLEELILVKTEGIPFFIEEFIKSLKDLGAITRKDNQWHLAKKFQEVAIPSTIQDVIMARVDSLSEGAKEVLQTGSAIEREFGHELIRRVTGLSEQELLSRLSALKDSELLYERGIYPQSSYVFKHALTRDVTYSTLILKRRKEIHEKIAEAMEELYPERLEQFCEILAYHYRRGTSRDKAVDYLTRAGGKSADRYALEEAHFYCREAFELLKAVAARTREEEIQLIDLLVRWAFVYHYRGDFKGLVQLFKDFEQVVREIDDDARLGRFCTQLGLALYQTEHMQEAERYQREALKIGERIGDSWIIGYACSYLSWVLSDLGRFDEALACGERAVKISSEFPEEEFLYWNSMGGIGLASYFRGDVETALTAGEKLLRFGQSKGSKRSEVLGHFIIGNGRLTAGDFLSALKSFEEAVEASADPWFALFPKFSLGLSLLMLERFGEAGDLFREVLTYSKEYEVMNIGHLADSLLGVVMVSEGRFREGFQALHRNQEIYQEKGRMYVYASAEIILGTMYGRMATGDGAFDLSMIRSLPFIALTLPQAGRRAEKHFQSALFTAERIGARAIAGQAHLERGIYLGRRRKTKLALADFEEASKDFRACGAYAFLRQVEKDRGRLEADTGRGRS